MIDAQVHAYERNHPRRPWAGSLPGPAAVTGDDLVAAMEDAEVERALLVSPWTLYGFDTSYVSEVYSAHPGRFRLIAPIDPFGDAADAVTMWRSTPGAVGIRLMAGVTEGFRADHPGVRATAHAAVTQGLPVCVFLWCSQQLPIIDQLARLYPDTQFVLDHLGLDQPDSPPPPEDPFADLDHVLALAQYPNVAVKVTGACTLSHQPFPFADLWEPLGRLLDAFGIERCMWGTDWTRAVALVDYRESAISFRDHFPLSKSDRSALLGGTVERIFGW